MTHPNKFWELPFTIFWKQLLPTCRKLITVRAIHSQRKDNGFPPTPLRREDIPVLPERYQVAKAGEQFLIFDSGVGDNERILIFATQLSKVFIFYPITASGLWMERLSYVQKYFIKFTPFMP